MKRFLPVVVLLLGLAITPSNLSAAAPADQAFTISLNGLQETPPNLIPGTGSGTATFSFATLTLALDVSFIDLLGVPTEAHIHAAPFGVPGGIILDVTSLLSGGPPGAPTTEGAFFSGSIVGTLPFPPAFITDLLAGNTYLNIHTTAFTGGEIRGQLVLVPEPTTVGLVALGLLGLGLGLKRRRC